MNKVTSLKIESRAIAAHIILETGEEPVVHVNGFEFRRREPDSGPSVKVCACDKSEGEWEGSYQAAIASLSDFNLILKRLGDSQRAIRSLNKLRGK